MSRFDILNQILSDFKVPRRKLELDAPIPLNEIKGNQDKIYEEALNNDYLAFTRNLKIAKTVPLNDQEKLQQDKLVNNVYNFEYRPNPDSKTDYDILKEGYELLYAVYLEQKRNLNNILAQYMKLDAEHSYVKETVKTTLVQISENIDTRTGPELIFQLQESLKKISTANMHYIQKLKAAIHSNITEKDKINILYDVLDIPKEEK